MHLPLWSCSPLVMHVRPTPSTAAGAQCSYMCLHHTLLMPMRLYVPANQYPLHQQACIQPIRLSTHHTQLHANAAIQLHATPLLLLSGIGPTLPSMHACSHDASWYRHEVIHGTRHICWSHGHSNDQWRCRPQAYDLQQRSWLQLSAQQEVRPPQQVCVDTRVT